MKMDKINVDTFRELKKATNTVRFMRQGLTYESAEVVAERIYQEDLA